MAAAEATVDAVDPETAYDLLREDPDAVLVDVRTRAEWTFVGLPDLSAIDRPLWKAEWVSFPDMTANRDFDEEMRERLSDAAPSRMFFICRSGARSLAAAERVAALAAAEGREVRCTNVAEGFEGDRDAHGRRGRRNGWKARGLPWTQT